MRSAASLPCIRRARLRADLPRTSIRRGYIAQVRICAALWINGFSAPDIIVIPKRRCDLLLRNYCTSQRSAAAHRLRRWSQGNRAGAWGHTGQGYGSCITGFDAVRLWYEYERGRGDALELLLKCERGMWWILKRSLSLCIRSLLKRCFRLRVGLADVNRHSPHQIGRVSMGVVVGSSHETAIVTRVIIGSHDDSLSLSVWLF